MSTTIHEVNSLHVTRFYSGVRRGVCVQLSLGTAYTTLDSKEMRELAKVLIETADYAEKKNA